MHSNHQQGKQPPFMELQNPSSIFSLYNNPQPQMILRQPRPDMPTMMFQHQQQQHEWRPPPSPPVPFPNASFKLGLSAQNNICYASNDVQNPIVHQYCNPSPKEPFWPTNMHTLENSKIQENLARSKGPEFSELDSMYNPARRSSSENNSPAANAEPSELPEAERRRKEKKKKKKKTKLKNTEIKEELTTMAAFFEGLLKQVMDHQDFLHKKYIEVIERMDRERVEREDEWRKKEAENYKKEAEDREKERSSALSREALITSYMQKIAGKSENFPTRR